MESFVLTATFNAGARDLYRAWLDSGAHSEMTGSAARIDPAVNGRFSAWEGYITGRNLELKEGKKIRQAWRTGEFPAGSADSIVEITFEKAKTGVRLRLSHRNIPDGQAGDYKKGWKEFYFKPMKAYFSAKAKKGGRCIP